MREWQSLSHVRWYCRYHVVFVPKYRKRAIFGNLRKQSGMILRDLCVQHDVDLIEGHAMTDHVHLLLSIPPKARAGDTTRPGPEAEAVVRRRSRALAALGNGCCGTGSAERGRAGPLAARRHSMDQETRESCFRAWPGSCTALQPSSQRCPRGVLGKRPSRALLST
jgi:hypothetical protein